MRSKTDMAMLVFMCFFTGMIFHAINQPIRTAQSEPLDTYHTGWQLVRETASEDGADFASVYALATDEGNFANMDSTGVALGGAFRISTAASGNVGTGHSYGSRWQFVICGGDTDNDTFSYSAVCWAKDNGMLQVICQGTGAIGSQDVVIYPDGGAATGMLWVDTLTLDNKWPKTQANIAGSAIYNKGGNGEVSMIVIEPMGIEYIQFVLYGCDGSDSEAETLTVYGRPY